MVLWKQLRTISLEMPEELLAAVDDVARTHFMSRSEYIRRILYEDVTRRLPKMPRESKPDEKRFWDVDDC